MAPSALKHLPKSWVTLNPVLATSAAIVSTLFHFMLKMGEPLNSGQDLQGIMSVPAVQLVGLVQPTEHPGHSHRQAELKRRQSARYTPQTPTPPSFLILSADNAPYFWIQVRSQHVLVEG